MSTTKIKKEEAEKKLIDLHNKLNLIDSIICNKKKKVKNETHKKNKS